MAHKILVITPRFPFDLRGACEQDRAHGIALLKKLGYTVHVITMCYRSHLPLIQQAEKEFGVTITPIVYTKERSKHTRGVLRFLERTITPSYWDGAAYEYTDPETQNVVREQIESFKPDLVWCDYTNLWPLYPLVKNRNIPLVTRSINYEPDHFYNKSKKTPLNWLKYKAKQWSELKVIKESDHLFAITPKEEAMYRSLGATHVSTLPLRRLGVFIGKNTTIRTRETLQVFFMGSNYSVHHMYQGLRFILDSVYPLIRAQFPDQFSLHILGGKIPEHVLQESHPGVQFHGYVADLDAFIADMDIALAPSLSGEGMQQKVFEPIVRGIPTITSTRALAGYPFISGTHVEAIESDDPKSFVDGFTKLRAHDVRKSLSEQAVLLSHALFSESILMNKMHETIKTLITSKTTNT